MLYIFTILFCLISNMCFAGTAKDMITAFKKLDARCQTGISYKEFNTALGDLQFYINEFKNDKTFQDKTEINNLVTNISKHYANAKGIWSVKFSKLKLDPIPKNNKLYSLFIDYYPEAEKDYSEGGVLENRSGEHKLDISHAVGYAFNKASKDIKAADQLIKTIDP